MSEMEAYAKLLNAILDETIDAAKDVLQPPPPDVLYHYTTPAGVLGIIESGSIYLSDALFLNDQSELLYGRELVAEALREELAAATDALLKKVFRVSLARMTPGGEFEADYRFYVASFCEDGNLLSQWRAYGSPGSGFNLGFVSKGITVVRTDFEPKKPALLRRVEYDREKQKAIVKKAISVWRQRYDAAIQAASDKELEAASFSGVLDMSLVWVLPQFKHPVFSEEREWRLVYGTLGLEVMKCVKFRQTSSAIIPYLPLDVKVKQGALTGKMPLAFVTHAPSPEPGIRKRALRELLDANGYGHAKVKGSDIPLRVT